MNAISICLACLGPLVACAAALAAAPPSAPAPETPRTEQSPPAPAWAEMRVVDAATGRGVPLVELETVHAVPLVTDNAGRIAFAEPGLVGRELYFSLRGHGYELPADGFGFRGARVTPRVDRPVVIRVTRRVPAERLCRLTGEGRWRDSLLLGYEVSAARAGNPGLVAGQDSIQAAIHRERVYWFWGDTQRLDYPLGLFRMAGATTPLAAVTDPAFDPAEGLDYDYFTDPASGFVRPMMPLPQRPEGVVWVSAVFTVPDVDGRERLCGHYSRRRGLREELEQGIAVFDDERAVFEPVRTLLPEETWRRPAGHPIVLEDEGARWLLFGSPTPNVRCPATLRDVLDPARYEAFTCAADPPPGESAPPDKAAAPGQTSSPEQATSPGQPLVPRRAADGRLDWRWQRELPPVDSTTERGWLRRGLLRPDEARFSPADAEAPERRVLLHSGTVRWNAYRGRWILIAGESGGGPSFLGEVWYAEAPAPTGPFRRAVRIATHDRQTFYNVCQHPFLDRDGGRTIHFEGTYTNEFSGNPHQTPRYQYNQLLYRLDLAHPALMPARGE